MSPGLVLATQAQKRAITMRKNRETATRLNSVAFGLIMLKYISWLREFAIARSKPSAVERDAARPPAAVNAEIVYGSPFASGVDITMTSVSIHKSSRRRGSVPL